METYPPRKHEVPPTAGLPPRWRALLPVRAGGDLAQCTADFLGTQWELPRGTSPTIEHPQMRKAFPGFRTQKVRIDYTLVGGAKARAVVEVIYRTG